MDYSFKYGRMAYDLEVPAYSRLIKVSPPGGSPDREAFMQELDSRLKPGIASAGIVVSDKTRSCDYHKLLPWVISGLKRRISDDEAIKVYIAYGTHPKQTERESLKIYGDIFNRYEFIHHNCDETGNMITRGHTSRGTPVTVRKDIFDHDQLILLGAVSHHYFAGYGGGRKLLFPGLAERQAIYSNHSLFIDFAKMSLDQGCGPGMLEGNPAAEDLLEADRMMPEKIIISGIPGDRGNVSRIMFAGSYDEFLPACTLYDEYYRKYGEKEYDNVIASAGGYPKDINFIQAHKSLHNAASFVKDGGRLIMLAECTDGIGNEGFLNIFSGSKQEIFEGLKKQYSGNGGTALSLLAKTERINISMLTRLSSHTCNTLNIRKLSLQKLKSGLAGLRGSTAIIGNAGIVYR